MGARWQVDDNYLADNQYIERIFTEINFIRATIRGGYSS
jgi:hypothetical protein